MSNTLLNVDSHLVLSDANDCSTISACSSPSMDQVESIEEILGDVSERLDFVEQKVDCLPGLVADALCKVLDDVVPSCSYIPLDVVVLDGNGGRAQDQCGSPLQPNIEVSGQNLIMQMMDKITNNLRMQINYDELNALRARIHELEEDLGYRKKVAEKLMEDCEPAINRDNIPF